MSTKTITGKPCKTCGSEKRYYNGGGCIQCMKRRSSERARSNVKGVWKHRISNIDPINKTALCLKCGITKIEKKKNGWRCKTGKRGIISAPYNREYYIKTKKPRKIGPCDICKKEKPLCWDHDHKSGQHRGWLCHYCNVGIGFLQDDIEIMRKAIYYLSK